MADQNEVILEVINDMKSGISDLISANENTAADLDRLINSVEQGNVSQAVIDELKSTRDSFKNAVAVAKVISEKVPEPSVAEPPVVEPPIEEPPVENPPVDENGNPI